MTKTDSRFPFTAHARSSGLTIPGVPSAVGGTMTGRTLRQGETFEVTAELYAETLDRNGDSFLDMDASAQTKRWGKVLWAEGPAPEGMGIGQDDEGHRYREALKAREYALRISDPMDRALALKQVQVEYGDALNPIAQSAQYIPAIR